MHITESLKNFLFDLDYFITLYENSLYVFNYEVMVKLSKTEIILAFKNFKLVVSGNNLIVKKMTKQELRITGVITNLEYKYE